MPHEFTTRTELVGVQSGAEGGEGGEVVSSHTIPELGSAQVEVVDAASVWKDVREIACDRRE